MTREDFIYAPLWWHTKGLQQTSTGYGAKLATPYKVLYDGKLRRVYCRCFSNTGTLYIMQGKNKVIID